MMKTATGKLLINTAEEARALTSEQARVATANGDTPAHCSINGTIWSLRSKKDQDRGRRYSHETWRASFFLYGESMTAKELAEKTGWPVRKAREVCNTLVHFADAVYDAATKRWSMPVATASRVPVAEI